MTDFTKDINELYDKVGREIQTLNTRESLSREEVKAALDAICLMHKIRHFEDDGEKYGWNEDGYSQKGWTVNEIQPRYPYAYGDGRSMNYGRSTGYPMYGNSYDNRGYSRHDGADDLISRLEGLNDRDRAMTLDYMSRLRG